MIVRARDVPYSTDVEAERADSPVKALPLRPNPTGLRGGEPIFGGLRAEERELGLDVGIERGVAIEVIVVRFEEEADVGGSSSTHSKLEALDLRRPRTDRRVRGVDQRLRCRDCDEQKSACTSFRIMRRSSSVVVLCRRAGHRVERRRERRKREAIHARIVTRAQSPAESRGDRARLQGLAYPPDQVMVE